MAVRRLIARSWAERQLLLAALGAVGTSRFGLWVAPQAMLGRQPVLATPSAQQPTLNQIVRAIRLASRCVPAATCLVQAIAGISLLARHGYAARLCIGVARDAQAALEAHAWIVYENQVVLGDLPDLARFQLLGARK